MSDTFLSMSNSNNYKRINIRVTDPEYAFFKFQKEVNGLSARDIVEALSRPCAKCSQIDIVLFTKKDKEIKLPRNIFKRKKY